MQFRPEVAVVGLRALVPGDAERLAGEAAGPERRAVRPRRKSSGVGESADPSKEVALGVTANIACGNRSDVAVVNVARRDQARCHQIAKPLAQIRIDFVVVDPHVHIPMRNFYLLLARTSSFPTVASRQESGDG